MTANVSKINGVTRLHTFEVDLHEMEWRHSRAHGSAEASTLGFKPGQWPDSFHMRPFGTFTLQSVDGHGTHVYACDKHTFTIFND
jgi:hypothetical protein